MAWSTSISWDGSQNMDSYCTNQPVQWNLIGVFLMINLWKLGEIYGSQVAEHVSEKKHVMWRRSYGYDPQAGFYNSHATSNLLMGHPMFMRCIANEGRLARESYHKRPVSGFLHRFAQNVLDPDRYPLVNCHITMENHHF